MQTGNPDIRPFHFARNTRVTVELPPGWAEANPSSIFNPINGLAGTVVAESSTMEGYYHVRIKQGPGGFPADPLYLLPWAFLQLAPCECGGGAAARALGLCRGPHVPG